MMIRPGEARDLCSDSEWELVRGSFSPVVETLPPSHFAEAVGRFEATLNLTDNARAVEPPSKNGDSKTIAEETRAPNKGARFLP
jgi:hypothetical protein